MNKIIIIVLISTTLYAQEAYYNIGISTFRGAISGAGEALRNMDGQQPNAHYNRLWHQYAFTRDIMTIAMGINLASYSKMKFWKLVQGLFTSAAFNFTAFQVSYNLTSGFPAFRQSTTSGSMFEKYATVPIMVLLIGTAITLELIID